MFVICNQMKKLSASLTGGNYCGETQRESVNRLQTHLCVLLFNRLFRVRTLLYLYSAVAMDTVFRAVL